jgi:flagellar basal body rod protein FlgC
MKVSILAILLSASTVFAVSSKSAKDCQIMKNKEMEMEVISDNIANADATKTPEGGAYKSKKLVCKENMCIVVTYKTPVDMMAEMQSMIDARRDYEKAARNCKEDHTI